MGDLRAEQYTILPFTRNAVGPADVTETVYPRGNSTTSGFQVALSVLITSGMHCLASSVEDYQSSPALSFYKDFPSVWDDTPFHRRLSGRVYRIGTPQRRQVVCLRDY